MKPIVVSLFDHSSIVALVKFAKDIIQCQEFIFVLPKRIPGRNDQEFMYNVSDILSIYLIEKGHRVSSKIRIDDMTNDVMYINSRDEISTPCINCQCILYSKLYEIIQLYDTPNLLIGNYNLHILRKCIINYYTKRGVNFIIPCQEFNDKRIEQLYNEFCTSYDLRTQLSDFNKCVVKDKEVQDMDKLAEYCEEYLLPEIELLNNKGGF